MAFPSIGKDRVRSIPLDQIMVNPAQPRTRFKEEALQQLAQSIEANGLLQPVTVRQAGPGKYQLVAGERRCRACLLLGHTHIPAIVKDCSIQESAVLALIENIQRQDLDPFDQAEGISRLIGYWGVTQEEAARKLGLAQSTLANKLRLLRLPPEVLARLRAGGFTERHARALLKLEGSPLLEQAVDLLEAEQLTVVQTEALVESLLSPAPDAPRKKPLFVLKDVRLFLNTLKRSMELMRSAGVNAQCRREDREDSILLTISIPRAAS